MIESNLSYCNQIYMTCTTCVVQIFKLNQNLIVSNLPAIVAAK